MYRCLTQWTHYFSDRWRPHGVDEPGKLCGAPPTSVLTILQMQSIQFNDDLWDKKSKDKLGSIFDGDCFKSNLDVISFYHDLK